MSKTLNQIIFFPPPKTEYFFQQHFKLNGRSITLNKLIFYMEFSFEIRGRR